LTGDEVDADRIVDAGFDRHFQLGADTVIGSHQNRVGKARSLEVKQATEAADLAISARPTCRAHQRLDTVDHLVAGIDIDTRLGIGEAVFPIRHPGFPSLGFKGATYAGGMAFCGQFRKSELAGGSHKRRENCDRTCYSCSKALELGRPIAISRPLRIVCCP